MKSLRPLLFLVAASGLPSAFAIDAAQERAERDRIKSERAQAEAAFASREKACRERFVVTSCIEDARRDRRQALERLRLQQEVLAEAQRKQRAAERMEEIRTKVSDDDAKRREATAADRKREKKRAEVLARSSPDGEAPGAEVAASAPQPATTGDEEARRRADYDKRQQEAREHREAVERRNAERAAKGKAPAKPLPVPGAPAASAASAAR